MRHREMACHCWGWWSRLGHEPPATFSQPQRLCMRLKAEARRTIPTRPQSKARRCRRVTARPSAHLQARKTGSSGERGGDEQQHLTATSGGWSQGRGRVLGTCWSSSFTVDARTGVSG